MESGQEIARRVGAHCAQKSHNLQAAVDPDVYLRVQDLARRESMTVSTWVRRAIIASIPDTGERV